MRKQIRGAPQKQHDLIINMMAEQFPAAQRTGFPAAMKDLQRRIGAFEGDTWEERLLPDLWFIDEECMSVVCIEVEDTCRLSSDRIEKYQWLWFMMDFHYWETHLLVASRWGALAPVPLFLYSQPEEIQCGLKAFELSEIYCIKPQKAREAARREWLDANPGYNRANFYAQERLDRRREEAREKAIRHRGLVVTVPGLI